MSSLNSCRAELSISFLFASFLIFFVFARELIPNAYSWADDVVFIGYALLFFLYLLIIKKGKIASLPLFFCIYFFVLVVGWMTNFDIQRLAPQLLGFMVLTKVLLVLFIGYNLSLPAVARFRLYNLFIILSLVAAMIVVAQVFFPALDRLPFINNEADLSGYSNLSFRKSAFFKANNMLGFILVVSSIFSIALFFIKKQRKYIFFFLLISVGLYGTYSRTALVLYILSISFFFFLFYKGFLKKVIVLVVVSLSVLVVFTFSSQWQERIQDVSGRDMQGLYRIQASLIALRVLSDNPFFGSGPASFGDSISMEYHSLTEKSYGLEALRNRSFGDKMPMTIDVYWSHYLAQYGLLSLVCFILLFKSFFSFPKGISVVNIKVTLERRMLTISALVLVCSSFTSFSMVTLSLAVVVFLFMGIYRRALFKYRYELIGL